MERLRVVLCRCGRLRQRGKACYCHRRAIAEEAAKRRSESKRPRGPDNRPPASKRGYDRRWHKLRRAFLAEHPYCEYCGRHASEVHHVIPIGSDDQGRLEWGNLVAVCHRCHMLRHAKMRAGGKGSDTSAPEG